jgi:RNA polymerase sigma-70 factor (ECF subfamily)
MSARRIKEYSDEALLGLIRSEPGSRTAREAVSELFGRFQGCVYQWCFRYTSDHDRALDLAQEVFLGAYESLQSFGGRASFSSWLFAITRNRCVSALRKTSPLEHAAGDPDLLSIPCSRPDSGIEEQQEREALLDLMRRHLEPREQEALCLQIFERLPVDSITQVLGITGSTGARSVLQSARRKLRTAMGWRDDGQGESNHD